GLANAEDSSAAAEAVALPAVSAEADPRRKSKPADASSLRAPETLQTIAVEPGVNEIINIAVGHSNRIVTPFKEPRVITTAQASVETSNNVIYVAPATDGLISMFLTESGDESVAINLTLQPKRIPPRELRLSLPAGVLVMETADADPDGNRQRKVGGGRSYTAEAGRAFDALAQGSIPQDFAFSREAPPPFPLCAPGNGFEVSFSKGQYLLGQEQEIYVGIVRNGSGVAASFAEPWCYAEGVIAVALWPRATLKPGEYAEIYLARSVGDPKEVDPATQRPSLLQAGVR
ncbi:MAG: hypothetical protein ACR2RE_02610, partial [Geminicoccaceae bacterium]